MKQNIRPSRYRSAGLRCAPVLAVLFFAAGCSEEPAVKFGLLVPVDRTAAETGAENGAQLALRAADRAGEGNSPQFQLSILKTSPSEVKRRMEEAAAHGVIGFVTADSTIAAGGGIFSIGATPEMQALALASFARSELHRSRALVISASTSSLPAEVRRFREAFSAAGGISVDFAASGDLGDMQAVHSLLARTGADVVFMPAPDMRILGAIRSASGGGPPIPVLGTNRWLESAVSETASAAAADPLSDTYVSAAWTQGTAGPRSPFFVAYRAAFGSSPDLAAALSYDAVSALATAAADAPHRTGAEVRKALAGLGVFRGATGVIQFGDSGVTGRTLLILRREHGAYVLDERIEPQGIHDFGEVDAFMNGNSEAGNRTQAGTEAARRL
ncbi:MAG TPA: ABC transporter substrate-binding protein [Spirochaetia bacterium]|nr:ABC transporter substrate-binding protein [Spirochaetia bacterium]